ncbi:dihydrofolate reductase family protein [Mycetocola sp. 2940]|uniref:dihydrofolate reductase family protein n=1 Tax=Mycetocola sp. 2940 TaxID=3156452 RepID=UPI0033925D98
MTDTSPRLTASAFLAMSLDGYIARTDGNLDWLLEAGAELGDTGYDDFFAAVDSMLIGRNTYDIVAAFDEYPYAGKRVLVLSTTLDSVDWPDATVHRTVDDALTTLEREGRRHVYVDGGTVVQQFLRAGMLDDITVSIAPVLIGSGVPLFGSLDRDVLLELTGTRDLPAGFTQATYRPLRSP